MKSKYFNLEIAFSQHLGKYVRSGASGRWNFWQHVFLVLAVLLLHADSKVMMKVLGRISIGGQKLSSVLFPASWAEIKAQTRESLGKARAVWNLNSCWKQNRLVARRCDFGEGSYNGCVITKMPWRLTKPSPKPCFLMLRVKVSGWAFVCPAQRLMFYLICKWTSVHYVGGKYESVHDENL